MHEQQTFCDAGGPWIDDTAGDAVRQARAELLTAIKAGPTRCEDIVARIDTPDGFDRRGFGPMLAQLHREGFIAKAGTMPSSNRSHHAGNKQVWVSSTRSPCCPVCGQTLGGNSDAA